jgi:hypothetical protein
MSKTPRLILLSHRLMRLPEGVLRTGADAFSALGGSLTQDER